MSSPEDSTQADSEGESKPWEAAAERRSSEAAEQGAALEPAQRPERRVNRPERRANRRAPAEESERRYTGPDRRKRPTPRFSRYSIWGGRRRDIRRGVELDGSFVDQYDLGVVLVLFWTGLMNAADSFFTLWHLQSGGIELNPVAAWMLEGGRLGFCLLKSGLIALPLVVLVVHKNFALARLGLGFAAAAYTVLFAYHISLL